MAGSRFGDDDLHDLIGSAGNDGNNGKKSEMKPFNLEHLSEGNLDIPIKRSRSNQQCGLLKLCCAYISYACDYAPKFCWGVGIVALLIPAYFLVMAVFFNPTEHFGMVHDYSEINSQYDLTVGKIDHWCLKGDNDSCRCEDPLEPQSRGEFRAWSGAQNANTESINSLIAAGKTTPDICFMGASIIEEMSGRWFGRDLDDNLKGLGTLFKKNFQKSEGGELDAVALGIAGDTSPTILWRLMNGEMPTAFNPKIWWLEVGLNDLGRSQCSEEVVVLGVLRVVEEILAKKPDATIVINSLFPLADLRGGARPGATDFKDSFDKTLRLQPTDKLARVKRHHGGIRNRNGAIDAGQTDHGDSAHIRGQMDGPKKPHKHHSKTEKNREGGSRQLSQANGDAVFPLFQHHRDLLFGWGREKKQKQIKMIDNKDKQKQYNPITRHEHKLPLWTSISAINRQLGKFANKHDKVFFFDATDLFTEREEGNKYVLKTDMISIRGHPTRKGYEQWEQEVIAKAKSLLEVKSSGWK